MSDHVSATDLANALREAVIWTDPSVESFVLLPDHDAPERWRDLVNRFDAERRKDLSCYLDEMVDTRISYMSRAKFARERGKVGTANNYARLAHDYNRRAVRLRRELRSIGDPL